MTRRLARDLRPGEVFIDPNTGKRITVIRAHLWTGRGVGTGIEYEAVTVLTESHVTLMADEVVGVIPEEEQ